MRIAGVVFCDFETAPAGGPSQLRTTLAGRTVLEHTLRRLLRIEGLSARCLFVRPRDAEPAAAVLQSTGLAGKIDLVPGDTGPRPRRELLTAARRWNLESWRGGLQGTSWFDEYLDPPAAGRAFNHYKPDGLLCLDGHQPALDPEIATGMLAHLHRHEAECEFVFTQAPPGLAGMILLRGALEELLEYGTPAGLLLAYRPEAAYPDPITHYSCYPLPPEIAQTSSRWTADTRRSRELLAAAFAGLGAEAGADALCLRARQAAETPGALPREVELELTTDDPLPCTRVRPRGDRVPRRQLADFAALERAARELGSCDDQLVWIGGHGDPLQHARFADVCRVLRDAGVYGLGVATPLVDLSAGHIEALFASAVDVLEVQLDAIDGATYSQVHGRDAFAIAYQHLARLDQLRRERGRPRPIIVPSLTRCASTLTSIEKFYEDAYRTMGSAIVHGYSTYSGVLPEDTLLSTTPCVRAPCRRLASRLVLLADGRAAACDQDPTARVTVGDWTRQSIREIWTGPQLAALRLAHRRLALAEIPTCGACDQWNRP